MNRKTATYLVLTPLLMMICGTTFAANLADPNAEASALLNLIHTGANNWTAKLSEYATYLLFSLAVIQLIWTFGLKAVDGNLELGSIVADLLRFIMTVSFFIMMIKYLPSWGGLVVDSFREAAAHAGGIGKELYPGDILAMAIKLSNTVADGVLTLSIPTAIFNSFMSVIILICFTFIAGFMFVTLVESYMIICASVFMMGFGGASWTREFATSPLKYIVSVGAKLFVLTLIVAIIASSADMWVAAYTNDSASSLTIGGLAIICAYLTKTIPDMIAGMINGTSMSGGGAIGSLAMAAAAGGAGLAAGAAMGAGAIANSLAAEGATNLAGSLSESLSGGNPTPQTGGGDAPKVNPGSTVGGGGNSAPKAPENANAGAPKAAGAAMKVVGSLAALSVPGMESAASVGNLSSGGSGESQTDSDSTRSEPDAEGGEPENTIRPAPSPKPE